MKITVLSVGRVRQEFVRAGEQEYLQRLGRDMRLELTELGIESPISMSEEEIKEKEAEALLKKLSNYDYIVVLDEGGKELSSKSFKELLSTRMQAGTRTLCFVIGGAYGFSERVRQAANAVLSLSQLTFPHQLARLVLVEQLYRAHTMMKGVKYHK